MLLEKTTRVVLTDFKTVLFRIQLVPCLWIRKAKNKNRFFDWSAISNYIRDLWTVNNALKRPSQFWGITGWGSFSVWKFRIKRYFKSTYSFVKFRLISNINADGTLTSSENGYKIPYKVKLFHLNVLVINNICQALC